LVLAGRAGAIDAIADRLIRDGIQARRLASRRAFHTALVEPSLNEIARAAARVALHRPQIPVACNVTGRLFETDRALDPAYFAKQTRAPVHFGVGVQTLIDSGHSLFLEIGAGAALTSLIRANAEDAAVRSIAAMPRPGNDSDIQQALEAAASVWTAGAELDWRKVDVVTRGSVISLPGYPFSRTRCWVGAAPTPESAREPLPVRASHNGDHPGDVVSVVKEVWAACLGHRKINVDDDYHQLGGDSLTAVRIAEHLTSRLGIPMRPNDLLEAPTPKRLAALVAARRGGELASSGIVIEARKVKICDEPLVLFHAVGGSVHLYGELVAALPRQTIRLVQSLPFAGAGAQPHSVEEMVRHYLDALQLDRDRPVHFAGASFGGLVAFEAARQWNADASVIMLDSPAPGVIAASTTDDADILAFMAKLIGSPTEADALRELSPDEQRRWILDVMRKHSLDGVDDEQLQKFADVFRANAQAMNRYRPAPLDAASITLVAAATRDHGQPSDPEEGWAVLTRGHMSVETVPGGHLSMLTEPNVAATARAIERAMARPRRLALARKAS
jgi:thioesterase domain-containing protein/acyl carrier protein